MSQIISNTYNFFSFHDSPITNCYLENDFLYFEFEFVFCFLNNNKTPAIYSSEGYPKIVIHLKRIINWNDFEENKTVSSDYKYHFAELIGKTFLAFSHENSRETIEYSIGVIHFELFEFQVIVFPTNLFLFRELDKVELLTMSLNEFPKTNLPVSFHHSQK